MLTAKNSAGYASPIGAAVDPVVFTVLDDRLHVLLVERREEPQRGRLSLPGGFWGDAEDADTTVHRKLEEKTGVREVYMEKLTFYATMGRDPRGWMPSFAYLALVASHELPDEDAQPAGDARWVAADSLPQLAFDHNQIVADGVQRLRERVSDLRWFAEHATPVIGDEFTLGQAFKLYKQLSGRDDDDPQVGYANFRRDLRATGLIAPTGRQHRPPTGRPAETFARVS
jgi:8-oxo-dGTP diphosphatase